MTTTASTGTSVSQTKPQPPVCWPERIALLDHDGRTLSEAVVLEQSANGSVLLGEVGRPKALLDYYFGKSGRRLMVDLGDRVVDGWLETRWDGTTRSWWIEPGEETMS
jgi:hypothetical protein